MQVLWGDDQLAADKALTIYDDLKSKGLLVERVSSTAEGLALKEKMMADNVGATTQAVSPAYLSPAETIFTNAPIYTDHWPRRPIGLRRTGKTPRVNPG